MHSVGPASIPSPGPLVLLVSLAGPNRSSPLCLLLSLSLHLPPAPLGPSSPRPPLSTDSPFLALLLPLGLLWPVLPSLLLPLLARFSYAVRLRSTVRTPLPPYRVAHTCASAGLLNPRAPVAGSKRNYSYLPSALSDSRLFRGSCSLSCRHNSTWEPRDNFFARPRRRGVRAAIESGRRSSGREEEG